MFKKPKSSNNNESDTPSSDWNMGVRFYDSLDEIKRNQRLLLFQKNYLEATLQLIEEIDWVAEDINKNKCRQFRGRADSLLMEVLNKNNNISKNIIINFIRLRRDLWDEEMRCGITRPKNNNDLSGVSITEINNR